MKQEYWGGGLNRSGNTSRLYCSRLHSTSFPVYSEAVQSHFHHPRNVGPLEGATHQGTAGTPGNGPYVVIWLKVEAGRVRSGAFQTFGCPAAVAAASVAVEMVTGRSTERAARLTARGIVRRLGYLLNDWWQVSAPRPLEVGLKTAVV